MKGHSINSNKENAFKSAERIAFFLPDLRIGGAEHMMAVIASALAQRGYKVDFVLVKAEGGYLETLDSKVKVVDLKCASTYTCLPALNRYLRSVKPEVMISALDLTNLFALIARKLSRQPKRIFIRLDNTQSQIKRNPIKKVLERMLVNAFYPLADGIIAVSKAVADDFVQYMHKRPEHLTTIYNPILNKGIYEKMKEPLAHAWFTDKQIPVILGIGRLSPQKNFELLINAFAKVHEKRQVRLMILGEGPEREPLEKLVKALGLAEDIALPGVVSNPYQYLTNADLFVLSSSYEGLPTVLVEAMACGCPVVSTDCPSGPREILDGGRYGRLVPVGDIQSLADAMLRSLDEDKPAADPAWFKQFDENLIVDQYVQLVGLPPKLPREYQNQEQVLVI